jgi:hypothetical protein
MEGERTSRAMARIDTALARIEAAALRPTSAADPAEFDNLKRRHDRLRAAVQDGLEQLDALIAGGQG